MHSYPNRLISASSQQDGVKALKKTAADARWLAAIKKFSLSNTQQAGGGETGGGETGGGLDETFSHGIEVALAQCCFISKPDT
jgi:hypothetical protein